MQRVCRITAVRVRLHFFQSAAFAATRFDVVECFTILLGSHALVQLPHAENALETPPPAGNLRLMSHVSCHGINHPMSMNNLQASLALDPRYFALRWFTTLLSREFDLPDTIRLWDSLFAAQDRTTFLVFLCVTLLLAQRQTLLAGDFASNLQLLQAYPPTDVPELLARSEALQLFSARGDAASVGGSTSAGGSREQRAREAAEGARAAAEQVNVVARKFWNAAADLAVGAAERMSNINEGPHGYQGNIYWGDGGVGKADAGGDRR